MNKFQILKNIFVFPVFLFLIFFLISPIQATVGDPCTTNDNCDSSYGEICDGSKCITEQTTEGMSCTDDAECDKNEKCIETVCVSQTSTDKKTDKKADTAKKSTVGASCAKNSDCTHDNNEICSGGKCIVDTSVSGGATGTTPETGKDVYISAGETELTSPIGEIDFLTLIGGRIIPAILGFVGVLAVLAVIYGGITYMLSFGNEQKMEIGKKILTYAVLGILAIAASYMIIQTIISLTTSQ